MKINHILAILLLTSGLMTAAQKSTMNNPSLMIESQSRFGFDETVETLSKTILATGWKISVTHDLQETMMRNGKEVLPVKVIELCNPDLAFRILSRDEFREVSPMLPCRIAVYEKADGNTYVARMNAPSFAGMVGGEAGDTILEAFRQAEEFAKSVIR